jgi:perosamine synthetase
MRINRTLPPAASPIYLRDILRGIKGLFQGERELERFRKELKRYGGFRFCFLVSSGKAALSLILDALHGLHPERDEVLIPAFTCYSVPSALVRAGLKTRLCDMDPDTLDINFKELSSQLSTISHEHANNRKLLAIVPAHLFALPADVEGLRTIVEDPEVTIVEDAAQALGAEWQWKRLGTLGDVAFFSFGRGKALSVVEGGAILTNDERVAEKIADRLKKERDYDLGEIVLLFVKALGLWVFTRPFLFWFPKSLRFLRVGETIFDPKFKIRKMSGFQAGMARDWQKKLESFKVARAKNSAHWAEVVRGSGREEFKIGFFQEKGYVNLIRYPVRITDQKVRKEILKRSERRGLGIAPAYPDSIRSIKALESLMAGADSDAAGRLARELVTLPVHPLVSEKDRREITELLRGNSTPSALV